MYSDQLIKHIGSNNISFCIDSNNIYSNIEYIKKEQIKSITLISREDGYNNLDLNFLEQIPFITEIHMGACNSVTDFNGLRYVAQLETFILSTNKNIKVDLSYILNLKFLSFNYSDNILYVDKLIHLEKLWVWGASPLFFTKEVFSNFTELKELQINLSTMNNFKFLSKNEKIETIILNTIKKEFSLLGLEEKYKTLRRLKLINSKKITDVIAISKLINLNELVLSNSVKIEDCNIFKKLTHLEALTIYGSSFFENGDLSSFKHIREQLKYDNIEQKKHYYNI